MSADALLIELEDVMVATRDARRDAWREALAAHGVVAGDRALDAGHGLGAAMAIDTVLRAAGAILDATARPRGASSSRLAIVTRARHVDVEFVLALAGLAPLFEVVVTADDPVAPRPDPAPHRRAVDKLVRRRQLRAGRVVALEDAMPGVRAARAAGVRCVAVGTIPAYKALAADAWPRRSATSRRRS